MTSERFSKRLRLLRATEFERVFAQRASASNTWIALYGAANELGYPRLGITVSRRIGGAVARNRWKRLLRESFRRTQQRMPPLDVVCVVRSPDPPPLATLLESMPALAELIVRRLRKTGQQSAQRNK